MLNKSSPVLLLISGGLKNTVSSCVLDVSPNGVDCSFFFFYFELTVMVDVVVVSRISICSLQLLSLCLSSDHLEYRRVHCLTRCEEKGRGEERERDCE